MQGRESRLIRAGILVDGCQDCKEGSLATYGPNDLSVFHFSYKVTEKNPSLD